jgi:NADH dehydrogenase
MSIEEASLSVCDGTLRALPVRGLGSRQARTEQGTRLASGQYDGGTLMAATIELATKARPHVIVIGGGFGGVAAARALHRAPVEVTLIDRRNHQLFQPLLYQVATGQLDSCDIAEPLRSLFRRQRNVDVILGDVDEIDPQARHVRVRGGDDGAEQPRTLSYDYLILASGCGGSYFGHDEYAQFAPGLKSLEDALEIRRRVLLAFELADREPDPEAQRELTTFVIVGAGPTGVELAGALADLAHRTPQSEFHHLDLRRARFLLVEGGPRVLPHYPPNLSASAERQLRGLGVEVRTGAIVSHVDEREVTIGDERIAARTILWAAGVSASPLTRHLGVPLDHHGRVEVSADLRAPGSSNIFVIGDLASIKSRGVPVPGVAPAAIQQGRHAAKNISRQIAGRETLPFRYWNKGTISTIGRRRAVADLGRIHVSGFLAWIAYLSVHLFYLVGIRRRLVVCVDWVWSYFSRTRSARVLTETAEGERARAHRQLPAHS